VLLAVALGYLAASLIPQGVGESDSRSTWDWFSRGSQTRNDDVETVGIDGLVAGDNK
jgi:hypothetical protein